MIHLTTGLPGNGKTLYTISVVKERAERENRPVYYSGIPGLSLPWELLDDPKKWFQCPAGSIIVIDECQGLLPTRGQGAATLPHVAAFSTHRHQGHDVYLITQEPMQFDHFVRRLVGVWWHLVRPFGLQYAQLWEFQRVGSFDDKDFRKEGQKRRWDFPKALFGVYRSAEVHTHKRRLPWRRLAMLGALLSALAVAGVVAYQTVVGMGGPAPSKSAEKKGKAVPSSLAIFGQQSQPGQKPVLTTYEYAKARLPRIADLPESAPVYDEVAKPVTFPRVSACWQARGHCRCFSQQGTLLIVSDSFCSMFVAVGAFDPYKHEGLAPPGSSADQRQAPQGAVAKRGGETDMPPPVNIGPASSRPGGEVGTLRVLLEAAQTPEKVEQASGKR